MNHKTKIPPTIITENYIKEGEAHLAKVKKKEKFLSIGIYVLIILMTMALMIILFNIVEF